MDFLQYVKMDSFLHKLDPRTKFFFFVSMSIVTSFVKSGVALAFLLVLSIAIWVSCSMGKYIRLLLRKMRVLLLFIFLLWTIIGLFQVNMGPALLYKEFGFTINNNAINYVFSFEWYDLYKGFIFAVRIFLMVSSFYTVILSTNFSEIILGLRKAKIPYPVAFGIGLVFQIIPIIISEYTSIMEAQSSRGLEIEKCNASTKVKNLVTASLPLFFRVLSKGHAISLAMHYYKLDFNVKRTSYKNIKITYKDYLFFGANIAAIAIAVVLHIKFYIAI